MKYAIFSFVILLVSCISPQKNFRKGNYNRAYYFAIKKLENGKLEHTAIANRSFNEMIKLHQTQFNKLKQDSTIIGKEKLYSLNLFFLDDYEKGQDWLSDDFRLRMEQLGDDQKLLAFDIAQDCKDQGDSSMFYFETSRDKFSAQDAYYFYVKSQKYASNEFQLDSSIQDAKDKGTIIFYVNIVSRDIWVRTAILNKFKNLKSHSDEFLEIYFNENEIEPDCIVDIDFDFIYNSSFFTTNNENFTKDVQNGFDVVKDTSGIVKHVPKYLEVQGSITTNTTTRNYEWYVNVSAEDDYEYFNYESRRFSTSYQTKSVNSILSGDQRAIPEDRKFAVNKTFDSELTISDCMLTNLYNQIRRYLLN